jgi:hypothetical protein
MHQRKTTPERFATSAEFTLCKPANGSFTLVHGVMVPPPGHPQHPQHPGNLPHRSICFSFSTNKASFRWNAGSAKCSTTALSSVLSDVVLKDVLHSLRRKDNDSISQDWHSAIFRD